MPTTRIREAAVAPTVGLVWMAWIFVTAGFLPSVALAASGSASDRGPAGIEADGADGAAPGWSQWRGPLRDGRYEGPEWPEKLDAGSLVATWRVEDLGESYSGPIVSRDHVFTTASEGEEEVVRAYERRTGEEVWSTRWKGSMKVPFFAAKNGSWIRATPAFDGERLYVGGMRDVLVCLDASSGEIVWKVDFVADHSEPVPAFGFVSSPLLTDEHVYVQAGGTLAKLDKRDGRPIWRVLDDGGAMNSAFSSPILAAPLGVRQIVALTRQELVGVDPAGGDVLWRRPIQAFRGMNILTPVIVGDMIFTAPYGGKSQLLRLAKGEKGVETSVEWEEKTQGYMTSPVVIDGHAYFFTRSRRFACLRLEDGARAWVTEPFESSYWSLIARGDRILALDDAGVLRLIRATPEAYTEMDSRDLADDATWAHLDVDGREVFIREQGALAAYRFAGAESATSSSAARTSRDIR